MAAQEMYDYLSTVTPDYTTSPLAVTPTTIMPQTGMKRQIVHEFDDGSIRTAAMCDTPYFDVQLQWDTISLADAGTILDFWMDTNKANGKERSFYWTHPIDGHIYVVKFIDDIVTRYVGGVTGYIEIEAITLRVFGNGAS